MVARQVRLLAAMAVLAGCGLQSASARDVRITLPRRSELTPVQRLNRAGVDAIRKQQYEKAEAIFYKAYLYDPADPFTLNNLGYVSELQGQLDRAQKFYALASEQAGDAFIDRSNAKQLEGRPIKYAFDNLKDVPMRINRMNVEAIELLSANRNSEADALLEQALALNPKNPFTLNNLGVAKEALGDYEDALKYYNAAAASHSPQPIVVTLKPAWRGKPVSETAADSARELKERMQSAGAVEVRAAVLALRGVSAVNRNDWSAARQDFLAAYSLDPDSAFSLNNLGYIAERDGDLETAQIFYDRARKAADANARVGLATQLSAEGKHLSAVAGDSDQNVGSKIDQEREARRRQPGQMKLKRRNNAQEPPSSKTPPSASPSVPQAPQQ